MSCTCKEIEKLPDDEPVVYRILTDGTEQLHGDRQGGPVQDRLREHLAEGRDPVPGSRVRMEQARSIADTRGRKGRISAAASPGTTSAGSGVQQS